MSDGRKKDFFFFNTVFVFIHRINIFIRILVHSLQFKKQGAGQPKKTPTYKQFHLLSKSLQNQILGFQTEIIYILQIYKNVDLPAAWGHVVSEQK